MLWPLWLETLADCHELGNLWKDLVASLCNHTSGSVILCLASTYVVGFKILRNFYANCGESIQSLQSVKLIYQPCSRSRAGWTLTWLIKLKDGFKSLSSYFLWSCWVPTISVLTIAYCCSEEKGVWSFLKMLPSSRRTQPPSRLPVKFEAFISRISCIYNCESFNFYNYHFMILLLIIHL